MIALCRACKIPSRYVSGYNPAEGAMHAWVEVFLPGAGWLGLDPTNGIFCDERHLATAIGLTPADITPIGGAYYGKETVESEMTASVALFPLLPGGAETVPANPVFQPA